MTEFSENDPHGFNETTALSFWQRLGGRLGLVPMEENRLTANELKAAYERPPSFTQHIPVHSYSKDWGCFVFADGEGLGTLLALRPTDAEARPQAQLERILDSLENAFSGIPEYDDNPFVVQIFAQDEPLQSLSTTVHDYARDLNQDLNNDLNQVDGESDSLQQDFLSKLDDHYRQIGNSGGIFEDAKAGVRWGGKYRVVRLCIYRRFGDLNKTNLANLLPHQELSRVVNGVVTGLTNAGVHVSECGPAEMYRWLFTWFNPKPIEGMSDPWAFLSRWPATDDQFPEDRDISFRAVRGMPKADAEVGSWLFCGVHHRYLPVTGIPSDPEIGLLTLEKQNTKSQTASLFEKLPEGAIWQTTIIFTPQDIIQQELGFLVGRSTGHNQQAQLVREQIGEVQHAMARGSRLYPVTMGVFLKGETPGQLNRHMTQAQYTLQDAGFDCVAMEHDLVPLNTYLCQLPMAYQPEHNRLLMRARKQWLRLTMATSALFGQSSGTGRPGIQFFNRSGEPILFDPFSKHDREKTAHTLIFGPSGSGKSATLNYLLLMVQAMYNPHLVIIDVGGSYRLFGQYLKKMGKTVNYVDLDTAEHPLPPFANAGLALDQLESVQLDGEDGRQYIEEMESAALLIITGGEEKETDRLRRHERTWVREAIYQAARLAREKDRQTSIDDFVDAMDMIAKGFEIPNLPPLEEEKCSRVAEMRDSARYFLQGFRGKLFNQPGEDWPQSDVTIVDLGKIALSDQFKDAIALTFIGLMDRIQTEAEKRQASGRMTLVMNDEAHITTTNPLLADYLVKGSKMWRKWGMWLWLATQNLKDFPDASAKILNMAEWWICLQMPTREIDEIARFRQLSVEERALMEQTRKEPGKYVEGVLLSDKLSPMLFRNVPPAFALAIAQTEQHEKAHRAQIMTEHGFTDELDAVEVVANKILENRLQ